MKVSKDLDLAARLLMYLGCKSSNQAASLAELAKSHEASESEMRGLLGKLEEAKLVQSRRNGGRDEYLLARPAGEIHLGMVARALGPIEKWEVALSRGREGTLVGEAEGRPAWGELEKVILRGLESYTLDHLAWDTAYNLDS